LATQARDDQSLENTAFFKHGAVLFSHLYVFTIERWLRSYKLTMKFGGSDAANCVSSGAKAKSVFHVFNRSVFNFSPAKVS